MEVDFALADAPEADLVIIPGIHHSEITGLLGSLKNMDRETQWLAEQHRKGVHIAANCSGAFLVADTGALKQQSATTAWWLANLFQQRYPDVTYKRDTLLVQNEHTFYTGAMTATLGVMLQIVEAQVGRQLANPLDMEALASLHAVSVRTLSRRFKTANGVSPSEYLQNLRFEHTRLLLETTNLSIKQLMERVGYSSQSSLRRMFQKKLGMSPRAYRQMKMKKVDSCAGFSSN